MPAGILLALTSALCFAAAGALQHSATRTIALDAGPPSGVARWMPVLGFASRVLSHPVWWLGLGGNVLGFFFHSTALHVGSISLVQALLCVQLMFALPLGAWRTRMPLLARDWIGTASTCVGLVVLVAARGAVPQTLSRTHLVPYVAAAAATLIGLFIGLARLFHGRVARTALIGTAAGIGFSLSAVLIVVCTDLLVHGGLFQHWPVYALAGSGVVASILAQDAYASGSFPAALTTMSIADPLFSAIWGAILFDATRPTTAMSLGSMALAGSLIALGVGLLANSPTVAPQT
ncbi:DMT family transporter [Hamadaea tsunoensis]|uniref:DMT family transporter n=1 Tax=Hamadaea tsunoensis TaxID=53368 RepID=UPI000685FE25|nr:DMT family transporter [Hamadaea tsunoensis]